MADRKTIVIFGAGKIGRSFIGQLFGLSGYGVVFVDIDRKLVNDMNQRKSYPVVIRGEIEKEIIIPNVRAVFASERDSVAAEVARANLLAVSVGKNALPKVISAIAEGITKRYRKDPNLPLDIILAENMRNVGRYFQEQIAPYLPIGHSSDRLLGLVETSIGKMVPIITESEAREDPLRVFAEPYNELIVDGTAFRGGIPDVDGLAPKTNISAWVDRKAFIHNLGHATAAYIGAYYHTDAKYIYKILQDKKIYNFTRAVMLEAATVLTSKYPEDFSMQDLGDHIDDLLYRFQNSALRDTIFRVGQDLPRKLDREDRFMGIIRMAIPLNMPYKKILKAMVFGFLFRGKDEFGNMHPSDVNFTRNFIRNMDEILEKVCGLHPQKDGEIIAECKRLYASLITE